MYQYILGMYWYEHFRRVSSRVSGFQMQAADSADTDIAIELGRIGVRLGRAGGPRPVTDIMIDSEVGSNLSGVQV